MKNYFLSIALLIIGVVPAYATLTDGTIAPDFTLTDIDGNSFNLFGALEDGKTVFIEFVASWDQNSWNYHNTQSMQNLHALHGPNGSCSDDIIVLLIEIDLSTDDDDLAGIGNNSQGNWIENTSYRIFNPSTDDVINDYLISAIPTIYRLCPSKIVKSNGQLSAVGHVESMSDCSIENDIAISEVTSFINCSGTPDLRLNVRNINYTELTQADIIYSFDGGDELIFNWTGSIAEGLYSEVVLPAQTFLPGQHYADCLIVNADSGIVDMNMANNCLRFYFNVLNFQPTSTPLTQDFSAANFPYDNWSVDNPDQGIAWEWIDHDGGMMRLKCYTYGDTNQADLLITESMDLTDLVTPVLSFDVAYAVYSSEFFDALGVAISNDCGNSWSEIFYKAGADLATVDSSLTEFIPYPGQWRTECIDLTDFVEYSNAMFAFTGLNGWGNNIYVDNMRVSNECVLSVREPDQNFKNAEVYPNPAADVLNLSIKLPVTTNITISILDLAGAEIKNNSFSLSSGNNLVSMDIKELAAGYYFLKLNGIDQNGLIKFIVR